VGRRLVLGARTEEETEAALEARRPFIQIAFTHTARSRLPAAVCELHNQTMTLTTVREVIA
jgi:hypothetical protein